MKYNRVPSEAVIKRLPRYYRYLEDLMAMGISRVSSKDLSVMTGVTPSQVRQDFYCFGGFGLQGYGYDVEFLHSEIKKILGLDSTYRLVIIGAGNLGRALANYIPQQIKGFRIVGIFDTDPNQIGKIIGVTEIKHMNELYETIKENPADIAAITVPANFAREVAEQLIDLGIKGLWNFAPVELKVPAHVVIENIHLTDSLMVLGYKLSNPVDPADESK